MSKARQLAQKPNQPTGRKNLIINGAMQVAQRGTSITGISGNGYKALDRMRHSETGISTAIFTQEQVSDAPDGFSNSLKLTTTTAEGGIPANGRLSVIDYRIEAQDLQHLKYGTSDAKKITLSFWVKSSLTGLTTVGIYAPDGDRSIGRSYTINSANTWEYKTLTFDGDTGGTINNDNGVGLEILFQVAAGSDYTSTPLQTSWGASSNFNDELNGGNTLNLVDTLNATFQITGIQLEVGSAATEFEHRSYGEELALCQRYFETSYDDGVGLSSDGKCTGTALDNSGLDTIGGQRFMVAKRISPTVSILAIQELDGSGSFSIVTVDHINSLGFLRIRSSGTATGVTYRYHYNADAEL